MDYFLPVRLKQHHSTLARLKITSSGNPGHLTLFHTARDLLITTVETQKGHCRTESLIFRFRFDLLVKHVLRRLIPLKMMLKTCMQVLTCTFTAVILLGHVINLRARTKLLLNRSTIYLFCISVQLHPVVLLYMYTYAHRSETWWGMSRFCWKEQRELMALEWCHRHHLLFPDVLLTPFIGLGDLHSILLWHPVECNGFSVLFLCLWLEVTQWDPLNRSLMVHPVHPGDWKSCSEIHWTFHCGSVKQSLHWGGIGHLYGHNEC